MPKWPAQLVNYTNKTQYLFRIKKGVLEVNDQRVNNRFPEEEIRIPFRNIVYIGDSDTDIPCMTVVNEAGGHSIGVYDPQTSNKSKVYRMMRENRVKYFATANYEEGSELDNLIKYIIDKTAATEVLENNYQTQRLEVAEFDNGDKALRKANKRLDLILNLERSHSFRNTHLVIEDLREVDAWDDSEIEMICEIATENRQVKCVIKDTDVRAFFNRIISAYSGEDCVVDEVRALICG